MTTEQKHFIENIGKCELCGSKRNLQLHHMIPMVCENAYIDLDVEDNWLCVCGACHATLTPKNLLTKYGISRTRMSNKVVEVKYEDEKKRLISENEKVLAFYQELYDMASERLNVCQVLDVFDKYFD